MEVGFVFDISFMEEILEIFDYKPKRWFDTTFHCIFVGQSFV